MVCTTTSKTKKRSSLSCYECDAVFISSKLLSKHRETAHKIEPRNLFEILQKPIKSQNLEDEYEKKSCFDITFKCSYCGEVYKEKREFCNHLKKHHNVCSECDAKFTDRFFLMRHAKVCGVAVKKEEGVTKSKRARRRSSPVKSLFGKERKESYERSSRLRRRSNPVKERIYKEDSDDLKKEEEEEEEELEGEKISYSGNKRRVKTKGKQRKILDTEESEDEEKEPEKTNRNQRTKQVRRRQSKPLSGSESNEEEEDDEESDAYEMSDQLKRQTKRVVRITNSKTIKKEEAASVNCGISVRKLIKKPRKISAKDVLTNRGFHEKLSKNKSDSPEALPEGQFSCPICSKSFPSMSVVRRHSRSCGV